MGWGGGEWAQNKTHNKCLTSGLLLSLIQYRQTVQKVKGKYISKFKVLIK